VDSPSPFEVPWDGNFDIILSLWTVWSSMRVGILISSYPQFLKLDSFWIVIVSESQ
jgi:hypothetical protein